MKRYTSKTVLAMVFGWDNNEMNDYRYKAGRTDKPVYTIDGDYYCATKIGKRPAKSLYGLDWEWKKVESSFAESIGWRVWKA